MNDGKTYQEISNFLNIAYPTVAYWAVHGDPDNLESFLDGRREGNFHKVTEEYEELLLEVIEKEPEEYGYEFGRWTAARLAAHLEQLTGIKLSGSQVRRRLERKKYVYLWAKYSLEDKQNPETRKIFKEKLSKYLRITQENPERLQVWFWDESGFSLRVIRRKVWGKKGQRKKVTGQRRRGRVNIMGGLRYHDKKRINFVIKKGNAEVFYEQIKLLNNFLLQEWIEQGNKIERFKDDSAKIVIILDNASFHKRQDILKKIEAEMPNIILEFLPPYSPDYNLIELVWHSAKEYIAHRLFESVEQLEELLHKLLNEGLCARPAAPAIAFLVPPVSLISELNGGRGNWCMNVKKHPQLNIIKALTLLGVRPLETLFVFLFVACFPAYAVPLQETTTLKTLEAFRTAMSFRFIEWLNHNRDVLFAYKATLSFVWP